MNLAHNPLQQLKNAVPRVIRGSGSLITLANQFTAFSETSTYDDLVAGNCTSCQVSQDLSAYWTPALYFQDADTGEFTLVEQEGGMLA
jgi:hypothetical protein